MFKLNIGGGKGHPRLPGWTIVDLRDGADVKLDISTQPLPFPDKSVSIIFTSHTLEHILPQRLGFVLSEFRRVLADDGMIRIAVPDIEIAIKAYVARDEKFFRDGDLTYARPNAPLGGQLASWFYSTSAIGNGHVHCFDFETMAWWLRENGLTQVARSSFRQSSLPELRTEAFDRHPHESLYVEARKAA